MVGKDIKVAFVCSSPYLHGAGRILINMAKRLQDDYPIQSHIFACNSEGIEPFCLEVKKMGLHLHLLAGDLPWYMFVKDDALSISKHIGEIMRSADELVTSFRDLGINCVVINTLTELSGMLAASRLRIPSILWVHTIVDHMLIPYSGDRFYSACDRIMLSSANSVVCPSNWVKNHFQFFRKDIHVIPNFTFVPSSPASYPAGTTKFVCLNAWDSNKDIECIVEAADILKEKKLKFVLDLYGKGSLKDKLYTMIQTKHLNGIVNLHDRTADIGTVYANSHALVTASLLESFGMTLIEAMAYAKPIIVSETSGHKEILQDHKFGFFCEVSNPVSFAEKMEWVIRHPKESRDMGLTGYSFACHFYDGRESASSFFTLIETTVKSESNVSSSQLHHYFVCDIVQELLKPFTSYTASIASSTATVSTLNNSVSPSPISEAQQPDRSIRGRMQRVRDLYRFGLQYMAINGFGRFIKATSRFIFSRIRRKIFHR